MKKICVIGAGWSGSSAARTLHDRGFHVDVFEAAASVGGHSRTEVLNGVVYEPNGPHIFHTSNPSVAEFVQRFGLSRPYEHRVLTRVFLSEDDEDGVLLSWPPQIGELRELPMWPRIERELQELPPKPSGDDFESYVISMMGLTLYELLIRGYTVKQWGRDPSELSSRFAPKRVELRSDGFLGLYRDKWQFFSSEGINGVIYKVLRPVRITCGARITLRDLDDLAKDYDAFLMTGALDDFMETPIELAWRGIEMKSTYYPVERSDTLTPAYQVNWPSQRVEFTRTIETKHATGQEIEGTVVSEEYPGAPRRHYPVHTVERKYETLNEDLKEQIVQASPRPIFFAGRLANYQYINQDQAIAQGFEAAELLSAI